MIKYSLESEDKIPPLECHVCHQKSSYHNMSTINAITTYVIYAQKAMLNWINVHHVIHH